MFCLFVLSYVCHVPYRALGWKILNKFSFAAPSPWRGEEDGQEKEEEEEEENGGGKWRRKMEERQRGIER